MAEYADAAALKTDILFRCGEPSDGSSDFDTTAMVYLNRAYRTICVGGTELMPNIQEDWWWLRKSPPGVLTLQPAFSTGTVTVTNNNTGITFSSAPTFDADGWFLRVTGDNGDVFRVSAHTASDTAATLDSVYTGTSGSYAFVLFKLEYDLAADVLRLISPMRVFRHDREYQIFGTEVLTVDRDYPIALIEAGIPDRFAQVAEGTVRFNRYGGTESTNLIRVEYDYLSLPDDLEDDSSSIPVVPLRWRHVLSDWASGWIMLDKNDDRADALLSAARNGLSAMAMENRHRLGAISGGGIGQIRPRQDHYWHDRGPRRTDSGIIIG